MHQFCDWVAGLPGDCAAWAQAYMAGVAILTGFIAILLQHQLESYRDWRKAKEQDQHRVKIARIAVRQMHIAATDLYESLFTLQDMFDNRAKESRRQKFNDARALLAELPLFEIPDLKLAEAIVQIRYDCRSVEAAFHSGNPIQPSLDTVIAHIEEASRNFPS